MVCHAPRSVVYQPVTVYLYFLLIALLYVILCSHFPSVSLSASILLLLFPGLYLICAGFLQYRKYIIRVLTFVSGDCRCASSLPS